MPTCCQCPTAGEAPAPQPSTAHAGILVQTAALTPAQRAEAVDQIVAIAQKGKLTAAGIFSSAECVEGIFNSRGLSAWHTQTSAEISITMLAGDSSGWQKANYPDVSQLDPADLRKSPHEKLRIRQPARDSAG